MGKTGLGAAGTFEEPGIVRVVLAIVRAVLAGAFVVAGGGDAVVGGAVVVGTAVVGSSVVVGLAAVVGGGTVAGAVVVTGVADAFSGVGAAALGGGASPETKDDGGAAVDGLKSTGFGGGGRAGWVLCIPLVPLAGAGFSGTEGVNTLTCAGFIPAFTPGSTNPAVFFSCEGSVTTV